MSHKKGPININARMLNKSEIARDLGVSRAYISMLLAGQRKNPIMINKIRNYLRTRLSAA